jgi:predicted outer membrane protein
LLALHFGNQQSNLYCKTLVLTLVASGRAMVTTAFIASVLKIIAAEQAIETTLYAKR